MSSHLKCVLISSSSAIALLKQYATSTAQLTAADAVQIFGGRGITKSGMGRFIEHVSPQLKLLYLTVR
jgi:alkylation response protein AidB-like acyl-CoA dehydrogenase